MIFWPPVQRYWLCANWSLKAAQHLPGSVAWWKNRRKKVGLYCGSSAHRSSRWLKWSSKTKVLPCMNDHGSHRKSFASPRGPSRGQRRTREKIYQVVAVVPRGQVATYGQIANIVGCSPREVGYAMAALPSASTMEMWLVEGSSIEASSPQSIACCHSGFPGETSGSASSPDKSPARSAR